MIQSYLNVREKDVEAVVKQFNMTSLYFPTIFPTKERKTLTWQTIENVASVRRAANVVAFGTSIKETDRPSVQKISGDLAKIAEKVKMDETELYEYLDMLEHAKSDSDLAMLIDYWANDYGICYNNVTNRIEWIALQSISRGKVQFTGENNDGAVSEFDIDYGMKHKVGYYGTAPWSDPEHAKPLSVDLKQAIKRLKDNHYNPKVIWMNTETFDNFAACKEVVEKCASYIQNALNLTDIPTLESVNAAIKKLGYLNGAEIVLIDQSIEVGDNPACNPFADNVVLITETKQLGETYWRKAADLERPNPIISRVQNGIVTLKKYAEEEPMIEYTQGVAVAFPVWNSSTSSLLLDVKNNSWNEGK